jgi:hypothetical protein
LAAGLALAGSLALGFGGSAGTGSAPTAPAPATSAWRTSSLVPTVITFYIVANEEQAELVRYYNASFEMDRTLVEAAPGYRSSVVLLAATPEDYARAQYFFAGEMSASNESNLQTTTFHVVDMR